MPKRQSIVGGWALQWAEQRSITFPLRFMHTTSAWGAKRLRCEVPDASVQQKKVRRVLIRMMLDLHSLVTSQARPTEEIIVGFAIRFGQYDGHPLDATQIAAATTLPRTSVRRHLQAMMLSGTVSQERVGRRVVYFFNTSTPETDFFFAVAEKVLRTAVSQLAKMDSSRPRHDQ